MSPQRRNVRAPGRHGDDREGNMTDLTTRLRIATESILDNEALRSGLREEAARSLLDWGTVWTQTIVRQTLPIEDDDAADEVMRPRMRALRGLMSALRDLSLAEGWPAEAVQQVMDTALAHARVLYGEAWQPPQDFAQQVGLLLQENDPDRRLTALLALFPTPLPADAPVRQASCAEETVPDESGLQPACRLDFSEDEKETESWLVPEGDEPEA